MGKNACSAALNRGTSQYGVKALEFYSGLGGMHFSCELAHKLGYIPAVEVLAAFDINPVANAIYEHNFGHIVRRVGTPSAVGCESASRLQSHKGTLCCRTTLKPSL